MFHFSIMFTRKTFKIILAKYVKKRFHFSKITYFRALVNIGSEVGATKIALISSSQSTIER